MIHPGWKLREVLESKNISIVKSCLNNHVDHDMIYKIMNTDRNITANSALQIERLTGLKAEYWMDLQRDYSLDRLRRNDIRTSNTIT